MENFELLAEITRELQDVVRYHDGLATVPAYVLEQLFLAAGLSVEQEYTEPR